MRADDVGLELSKAHQQEFAPRYTSRYVGLEGGEVISFASLAQAVLAIAAAEAIAGPATLVRVPSEGRGGRSLERLPMAPLTKGAPPELPGLPPL
jgi:hypothetical protein